LRDALASDEVRKQLANDGTEITPGTPEDYAEFIDKDEKKWAGLVKASGVEQDRGEANPPAAFDGALVRSMEPGRPIPYLAIN